MNESMNDEGDCRTAPATPGLLIMIIKSGKLAMAWMLHMVEGSTVQI